MESAIFDAMSRGELVAFALKVHGRNIALESENVALNSKVEALVSSNLSIAHQLDQLRRLVYGSKSERFIPSDPNQLELDLGLSMETARKDAGVERIAYTREKRRRKEKPVRGPLPADLPRVVVHIEPGIDTTGMRHIGDEENLRMSR